jgi:predicted Rossmann fold nucleotide-binding protein DprA/Smf involved in DNA uptake
VATTDAPAPSEAAVPISLDERQQLITQAIDQNATSLDTIIGRTDLPAEIVMQELTMLSLRGVVKRVDNQNYVRKKSGL